MAAPLNIYVHVNRARSQQRHIPAAAVTKNCAHAGGGGFEYVGESIWNIIMYGDLRWVLLCANTHQIHRKAIQMLNRVKGNQTDKKGQAK